MPIPSGSEPQGRGDERVSSPAKRPRLGNTADNNVAESLRFPPASSTRRQQARHHIGSQRALSPHELHPGNSATRRSGSPTQKVSQLTFLRKPVQYVNLSDKPLQQLPDDVYDLYRTISNIQYLESFIPDEVRHDQAYITRSDNLRGVCSKRGTNHPVKKSWPPRLKLLPDALADQPLYRNSPFLISTLSA
jgi:hypothetical protein